jgi:hypothetical protein
MHSIKTVDKELTPDALFMSAVYHALHALMQLQTKKTKTQATVKTDSNEGTGVRWVQTKNKSIGTSDSNLQL